MKMRKMKENALHLLDVLSYARLDIDCKHAMSSLGYIIQSY